MARMTAAQFTNWQGRMDAAIAAYDVAAAAKKTHNATADALQAVITEGVGATLDATIVSAGKSIDDLNYEYALTSGPTDTAAPAVVSTLPADGATSVPVSFEIKVQFSEEMSVGTITSANLYLSLANGTPSALVQIGNPVLTDGGKLATFSHTTPMAAATRYRVTVLQNVQDVNGNFLNGSFMQPYGFTTAA